MHKKHTYKKLTWIDLESPSSGEVKEIIKDYGVSPLVAEELLSPTLKPRLETHKGYLYLILHFPAIKHTHSNERNQEVDFIIGKNFLVTTRYDTVDSIHKFAQEFEMSAVLDKTTTTKHAGFIFYYMIQKLYHSLGHELEYIESTLEKIEDHIFQGQEKKMVRALSEVSRSLIDINQTIEHHESILRDLEDAGKELFGKTFAGQLGNIIGSYRHVRHIIGNQREFLGELRATNDSLLSTKQNEVMKVLTIMAFVTFPLTLLASLFGMNTTTLPLVGYPGDFWLVIGIMVLLAGLFFWFFKYKKWL